MLNIPHCVLGSSHIRIVEKLLDSGLSATDLLQKKLVYSETDNLYSVSH